jgi:hypothetical protein
MIKSAKRFTELFDRLGIKFEILNDILWKEYQRMVVPVGPAMLDYTISENEAKFLLDKFPIALLVRRTEGFKIIEREMFDSSSIVANNYGEGWYAVICTVFKDIEELSSKNRSEIRRGLKNCKVKRVEADFIAKNGFNVFTSAFERYKGVKKPSITEREYEERILKMEDFEDIIHYWGVFYGNQLIAYSENYIYDDIEVNYSTIKFHPVYLKLYPAYALIYAMNKYYLKEQKFKYVNDGFRNILHQTNIQKFLIDKFGFKKAYTNLYIFYKPYFKSLLRILSPFQTILKRINPKIGSLYLQDSIKRRL